MLRDTLIFLGLLLIVLVYQTIGVDIVNIGLARPDLIIVVIVWLTLTKDLAWGVAFGFAAGMLLDSQSPQFLGLGAFLKVLAAVAVFLISHRVRTEGLVIRIGLVGGVVIVHDVLYFMIVYSFNPRLELISLLNMIIPSALYTSIVAAGVLYLSERQLTIRLES
jgi:rod shape-determining protein MreD